MILSAWTTSFGSSTIFSMTTGSSRTSTGGCGGATVANKSSIAFCGFGWFVNSVTDSMNPENAPSFCSSSSDKRFAISSSILDSVYAASRPSNRLDTSSLDATDSSRGLFLTSLRLVSFATCSSSFSSPARSDIISYPFRNIYINSGFINPAILCHQHLH